MEQQCDLADTHERERENRKQNSANFVPSVSALESDLSSIFLRQWQQITMRSEAIAVVYLDRFQPWSTEQSKINKQQAKNQAKQNANRNCKETKIQMKSKRMKAEKQTKREISLCAHRNLAKYEACCRAECTHRTPPISLQQCSWPTSERDTKKRTEKETSKTKNSNESMKRMTNNGLTAKFWLTRLRDCVHCSFIKCL